MTGARQAGKTRCAGCCPAIWALVAVFVAFCLPAAAVEPKIVIDPNTGLALNGVDPVAYFTDGKPILGSPDLELTRFGTVWRFRNVGNRAAFLANPDVYLPQFGGYDPVAILRDRAVAGHPLIWAVAGDRLYLFYDETDRAAFLADTERVVATANRKWPDVERTIGR